MEADGLTQLKFPSTAIPISPERVYPGRISPWIDEQVWGHRLWDGQTPWLLFLEFLTVAEGCRRDDGKDPRDFLKFRPYRRMHLRNLLFLNPHFTEIAERFADSDAAWDKWSSRSDREARGLMGLRPPDFSYLKTRFHSFHDFATLVAALQGATVEAETNRRWTSQFVFPFGRHALYEDLNVGSNGEIQRGYVNFGRTGELLYLMLRRSSRAVELSEHLDRIFDGDAKWNALLEVLQPAENECLADRPRGDSYLPYSEHPVFDLLAEDWLAIFDLDLPGFDAFQHLVTLGPLHVMLYQLWVASDLCQRDNRPYFVCEAIAPKKTLVRELSATNYEQNRDLTRLAVEAYIKRIEASDAWQKILKGAASRSDAFIDCERLLWDWVWWGNGQDYPGIHDPDRYLKKLTEDALHKHHQHAAKVHRAYGGGIGLVSRRGTLKLRYAPTDGLLKTLVLANVLGRMDFGLFLNRLYERYGLIFATAEAERGLPDRSFNRNDFEDNADRLEQRLSSLGMLERLSDSCAYVVNPHSRAKS